MTKNLLPLERYDYVGSDAKDPDAVMAVDNYLRTTRPTIEAREIRNNKYEEEIGVLGDSVLELGKDLGLDLNDRLRGPDYIHIYQSREYADVRLQLGRHAASAACSLTSGDIFASRGNTRLATLAHVNHELVHVMSYKSIRPEVVGPSGSGGTLFHFTHIRDGYSNHRHDSFNATNEILTEITNIDLMRNYWPRYPELKNIARKSYEDVGYSSHLILFDELLRNRFDNPHEVFKQLQRGLLTGEMGTLRIVTSVVGADVMRKVAALDAYNPDSALLLAQELGLDEATRKIKSSDSKDLLSWL